MNRRAFIHHTSLLVGATFFAPTAFGVPIKKAVPRFKNGDTILFIGDSITHGGWWYHFIENYYLTRFPHQRFRFVNKGISGDKTGHVLQRMQTDILGCSASKYVVMLGMNNTGSNSSYTEKTGEDLQLWQEGLCETYTKEMQKIIDNLKASSLGQLILVTPSPYDETAQLEQPPALGKNKTLNRLADGVKLLAKQNKTALIEFFDPMLALNRKRQATNPSFTVISNDRVHPSIAGHQLMAFLFLQQQEVPALVSFVRVNAAVPKQHRLRNATLTNWTANRKTIEFNLLEDALPYPIDEAANEVFQWVALEKTLNQQILHADSISPGSYHLRIDDEIVGQFTHQELLSGVNLAFNSNTPQYQQSQAVYQLNKKRATKGAMLRSFLQVEQMLERDCINMTDNTAIQAYAERKNKENIYYGRIVNEYLTYGRQLSIVQAEIDTLTKEIYQLNKPVMHQYHLSKQ